MKFNLTNKEKTKTIEFGTSQMICIEKIIIASLFGLPANEWFAKIRELDIRIKHRCEKASGRYYEETIEVLSYISNQTNPVIDLKNYLVPACWRLNPSGYKDHPHFDTVKFELEYTSSDEDNLDVLIFYDKA